MAKQYWLMKSEPDEYGWDDLCREGEGIWSGVRNYAAAKNMRVMKQGDEVFFYHSNIGVEIVGIMKVTSEHFPDPTLNLKDGETSKFVAVKVKPVRKLPQPVTLKAIKANRKLAEMALVKQSRLSVSQVRVEEWTEILHMAGE